MLALKRPLAKAILLTAVGGVTGIGILHYADVLDYNELGAVRIGRAGVTVAQIAVDYKWSLFWMKDPPSSAAYRNELSKIHLRSAQKLKDLCCKNKGAFVKVGQHLGSLDYLVPAEYVDTMKSLYSDAPQTPFEEILKVLRKDLGQDPSKIFRKIDPEPLGAASLAQVHKAELTDGTIVAVKVQHSKVERQSKSDIFAVKILLVAVSKIFPAFQFVWLAEETEKILPLELDFLNEGRNCERLGKSLSRFPFVKVPKIYWDLSTKRVLTMEYCQGGRIDDLQYYRENSISVSDVFTKISKVFNEMIFVNGYVHCDPHPGNMLVSKSPLGTPILTILDHGVHMQISEPTRLSYSKLWLSMLDADVEGMKKFATELGVGNLFDIFACMLTARSWTGVQSGIQNSVVSAGEMSDIKMKISTLLPEISDILNKVPRDVLLILKTNDLLRGISYKLKVQNDPHVFTTASLACTRVVYREKINHADSPLAALRLVGDMLWTLFKIKIFEFYLTIFPNKNPLVL